MLSLNSVIQPQTVSTRNSRTDQVSNTVIITTTSINTILKVINPAGNSTALTLTPSDGALTQAPATSLVIKRLA